jgi:class 3 adenylate cyclase/tetratricopeptide (TPR) repeat protein
LSIGLSTNPAPQPGTTLGKLTIVFTDIEESVRATGALGDYTFRDRLLNPLHVRAVEAIKQQGGTLRRLFGDSYLITFEHADAALRCVVEIQQALAREPITCKDAAGVAWTIRLRVGVHSAEAELSLDDLKELIGTDVNFAARVLSLGRGGQIIVSDSTQRAAGGRERFLWKQWPGRRIKSFDEPETVWELLWDGQSRGEPGSRWLPDWFSRDINEFVGRESLMDEIRKQLTGQGHPLLVLVGPPGVGKTRLAIQTVLGLCAAFEAGVAFVPLADGEQQGGPPRTAAGLASAIALAVKADSRVVEDAERRLVDFLNEGKQDQEWLIILDGWEAVDGGETLAWLGRSLQGCRRVRWLITSAILIELVNIGQRRAIPPMDLPTLDATPLDEAEAFQLFRARVQQRGNPLPLDEASVRAIFSILHQTEGHPLSIELAAAWVGDRGLDQIADLLREDPLKVLRVPPGGHMAGPARHQSIEAGLWWLARLLPDDQRAVLHRLADLPETFGAAQAEAEQGLLEEWLIRWRQVGLLERVDSPRKMQYRLRRVVREYCRHLGPGDSSQRPVAFRTLDDPGSTLADLIACWNARDRVAWSRHVDLYRRLAEALLKFAETLMALEVVHEGLGRWPADVRLRQLLGLALARSGAVERAWQVLAVLFEEGNRDAETVGLLARTHKGLGAASDSPEERARNFRESLLHYRAAFERYQEPWLGINAATLAMVVGEEAVALGLAIDVRALCEHQVLEADRGGKDSFYTYATLGEAELILGDGVEAARHYRRAVREARGRFGDIKSARDNARLLLALDRFADDREEIEAALAIPDVVIFVGHMIDRPGREGRRFPPTLEKKVARAIRDRLESMNALIGYSSAACGSDILFLEALNDLKDRDAEAHVVLPYDRKTFLLDSVDIIPGASWPARFDRCLRRAEVVTCSSRRLEFEGISYRFANLFLQGMAATRAAELETGLRFLVVWDGREGDGPGGTADTVARWRSQGHAVEVISLPALLGEAPPEGPPEPVDRPGLFVPLPGGPGMRIMAVLFARVVGFETLVESQFPPFVEAFLGLIAQRLDKTVPEPLKRNSWGNGIFLAFDGVRDAGLAALDLCSAVAATDWSAIGLPAGLALRVGLHAGPVFYGPDPVTSRLNPIGDHVARAAAIEAATPIGRACASREFAALAAAEGLTEIRCHYLGQAPSTGAGEPMPIYEVRAARRAHRTGQGHRAARIDGGPVAPQRRPTA